MRAATCVVLACQLALACGPKPTARPAVPAIEPAFALRVAQAEARRAGGIAELVELAATGPVAQRALALRGLGRIGGPRALEALTIALRDPAPAIVGAAATAIGLATSLDEADAGTPELTRALLEALAGAPGHEAEVIEAIGRAADASAQRRLVEGLGGPTDVAAACATALGRHGRRKLALAPDARDPLVAALGHAEPAVRHAAIWALAREHEPDKLDEATRRRAAAPIAALAAAREPEIRALAAQAIARRGLVAWIDAPTRARALRDPDWRVAAEAMRAFGGDGSDDAGRMLAATVLAERYRQLEAGDPREAHVVLEGVRALAGFAKATPALAELSRRAGASKLPALTRGWIECLAAAAIARTDGTLAAIERCGAGGLPDHLRLPLYGELLARQAGSLEARRAALRTLLGHADARVRAAGLTALPTFWKEGAAADRRAAVATVIAALGSSDPVIAGNAVDAATALYEAGGKDAELEPLDAAVIARAQGEQDPELAAALLELIGKRAIAAGAAACRSALAGAPTRARAAASCLRALGEPTPAPVIGEATPPAVDLAGVVGQQLRWHLLTTRGDIVITLRADAAPWAVATIVALTRRGFYDGLELHRVVPGFVTQGGDPTESGWGGPGFALPAEPSSGAGYVTGGVGMADAGRDSAGSQWFVMHAAAPHLDGRYTWIGEVATGQKNAEALLIGDRVLRAVIEVVPAR